MLQSELFCAKSMTMDFEKSNWKGLYAVFPRIKRVGCAFHWSQAIWRKLKNIGLTRRYTEKGRFYSTTRKVFALPFLPHRHIEGALSNLNFGQSQKETRFKR